jgi:hypothetical protein
MPQKTLMEKQWLLNSYSKQILPELQKHTDFESFSKSGIQLSDDGELVNKLVSLYLQIETSVKILYFIRRNLSAIKPKRYDGWVSIQLIFWIGSFYEEIFRIRERTIAGFDLIKKSKNKRVKTLESELIKFRKGVLDAFEEMSSIRNRHVHAHRYEDKLINEIMMCEIVLKEKRSHSKGTRKHFLSLTEMEIRVKRAEMLRMIRDARELSDIFYKYLYKRQAYILKDV